MDFLNTEIWRVTFFNDFHNKRVTLKLKKPNRIGKEQAQYIWRKLCGMKTCKCSDSLGVRGPQPIPDEKNPEFILRYREEDDGSFYVWLEHYASHW